MGVHYTLLISTDTKSGIKSRFKCRCHEMCIMNAHPFFVFIRKDCPYYLVAFKDDSGRFLSPISTKKKTEKEVLQVAIRC